jgi:hypothetical protein
MDRTAYHGKRQAFNTTRLRLLLGSLFYLAMLMNSAYLPTILKVFSTTPGSTLYNDFPMYSSKYF